MEIFVHGSSLWIASMNVFISSVSYLTFCMKEKKSNLKNLTILTHMWEKANGTLSDLVFSPHLLLVQVGAGTSEHKTLSWEIDCLITLSTSWVVITVACITVCQQFWSLKLHQVGSIDTNTEPLLVLCIATIKCWLNLRLTSYK